MNTDSDAVCEVTANDCTEGWEYRLPTKKTVITLKKHFRSTDQCCVPCFKLWHSGSKHSQDAPERQRTHKRRKQFSLINQQWHWEVIFLRQPTAGEDRTGGEMHCNAARHQKTAGPPSRVRVKTQHARSSKVSWHKHKRGPFAGVLSDQRPGADREEPQGGSQLLNARGLIGFIILSQRSREISHCR